ncbi:MAG: hypothetical protein RLZZ56_46 [Actinomycetota bacterium]|jgi:uncharacterized membrane protein (UPF0182 family)
MKLKKLRPAQISIIILVVLGAAFLASTSFYTSVLWYRQLGFENVLFTQIWAQTGLGLVAGAFALVVFGANLWVANRMKPLYAKLSSANDPLAAVREQFEQFRKLAMIAAPIALAILAGLAAVPFWQDALLFLNSTDTGKLDPQFNLDASFYLFQLPFLGSAVSFVSTLLLITTLAITFVHMINRNLRFAGKNTQIGKGARIQISILAALFLLVESASIWLDQYKTLTSASGLYTGATYADVFAQIPGLQIVAGIGVVVALLFLVAGFIGKWRLPLLATGLMVVSSMILGGVYPWMVQTFQVVPNERTLESEYIERNLEATRYAYGLDGVETIEYNAKTTASEADLRNDADTTANIRILDPMLVSSSFRQLEQYRQYYNFTNDLDVDRYTLDGKIQDTVIAARELNQSGLGSSQSWFNNVLVYTHGYGLVAAYGNQRDSDGQPVFLQKGIPTEGQFGEYEPRIYFGEESPSYSIVGGTGKDREMDYPGGADNAEQTYTTFSGNGGPKLDNWYVRLAYAIKFSSEQLLLSDAISDSSQILYDRNPLERVAAAAPYLTLDSDIYPAVVDGRIKWIVDGYTTSSQFPYSRAENYGEAASDSSISVAGPDINYIRNSVKATVDAYDGSVKLYAWDTEDPILKTWMKAYPGNIAPISEMSGALLSHVRYPADLFKIQRGILGQYHVTEAGAFYSQQDAWMVPNDPSSDTNTSSFQPAYYLTMQAPGADKSDFSLYTGFIPRSTGEANRSVLTGYLVANSDAGNVSGKIDPEYGKLRLLTLPKNSVVPGPGQVQNSFTTDPEVSRLLNLLQQGSTKVLRGNLLTLPVGGGLLYVQPVYIQSTGETSFPLLKKVLVMFGDKIAFEDTLEGALNSLFGSGVVVPPVDGGTTPDVSNLAKALAAAQQALSDQDAAMRAGDWAAYGKAAQALKTAIEAAQKAAGK